MTQTRYQPRSRHREHGEPGLYPNHARRQRQHQPSCRDTLPKRYGFIVLAPHNQIPPFTVAQRAREPKWAVVAETAPRSSREFDSEEILIHRIIKYQPASKHLQQVKSQSLRQMQHHPPFASTYHTDSPNKYRSIVSNNPPSFSVTAIAFKSPDKASALQLIARKAIAGYWDIDASNTRTSRSIVVAK